VEVAGNLRTVWFIGNDVLEQLRAVYLSRGWLSKMERTDLEEPVSEGLSCSFGSKQA